jgi:hypothetical protein
MPERAREGSNDSIAKAKARVWEFECVMSKTVRGHSRGLEKTVPHCEATLLMMKRI